MKNILYKSSVLALTAALSSLVLPAQAMHFSNTPQEIKVEVAKKLGVHDLKSFGGVSKSFNEAMKSQVPELSLYINASQLTADNVVILRTAGTLELKIDAANDDSMKRIGQLTNLKRLELRSDKSLTNEGLAFLKGLTNLEYLNLEHTNIGNVGLAHLQGLSKLDTLILEGTKVTDAGHAHLKGLPKLDTLWLGETDVTDAGLEQLKEFPNLKHLSLVSPTGTPKTTPAGIQKLREARPDLLIGS